MNIPHEYFLYFACTVGGLMVGLIGGFCAACYTASDLTSALADIFNHSPKDR